MLARDALITALDFETTGRCRGQACLPWQVGLAEARNGCVLRQMTKYLRVPKNHHFNPYTPGRWGELRDVLDSSNTLAEEWPELSTWLPEHWLVAHNAPVERGIIKEAYPLHDFSCWLDTLRISRIVFPRLESYALGDLLERLKLGGFMSQQCPELSPHDALFDAMGCVALLYFILSQPGWQDVTCEYLANL